MSTHFCRETGENNGDEQASKIRKNPRKKAKKRA